MKKGSITLIILLFSLGCSGMVNRGGRDASCCA